MLGRWSSEVAFGRAVRGTDEDVRTDEVRAPERAGELGSSPPARGLAFDGVLNYVARKGRATRAIGQKEVRPNRVARPP